MQREVTVFAPTDEAFAKLPEGLLESLTKEQKLAIVSRHFIPGLTILASDVASVEFFPVQTFLGESLKLSNNQGVIGIAYKGNSISVVSPDVKASNGVIHVINELILPGNVVDVAMAAGNFTTLLNILSELEVPSLRSMTLVDVLKMQREVTVFAPTDEAFAKLPEGTLESLTKEQKLAIVSRHFVPGVIFRKADVIGNVTVNTFGGETIEVFLDDAEYPTDGQDVVISYEGSQIKVATTDVMASNGVIHVIDDVILPAATPPPPTTVQMCFVTENMGRSSQVQDHVLLNIQVIRCKPDEFCDPAKESQYNGQGLGTCKLGNVVDVAKANGNFKTLLQILSELEVSSLRSMTLVDILRMQRDVTVFAPTDEAFAKLPPGTLESLTEEQKLAIVSRHFIPGVTILASDVTNGPVETFGGESINLKNIEGVIEVSYKGFFVTAFVTDVKASNGVIHVIDKIIVPAAAPPPPTTGNAWDGFLKGLKIPSY